MIHTTKPAHASHVSPRPPNTQPANSRLVKALLRAYESPNVTFLDPDGTWPIVWDRAKGVHVWDAEGKKYLDLTGAFGVAAAGHANPRVVRAGHRQMGRLLHAMGDVHPHALKAQLARELSRITFERWSMLTPHRPPSRLTGKTIFCNSGFEAVEAALKTAMLGTGKPGVVAFEGAYHGLGYGALNATHREHFRSPFRSQLREFGYFVPFPATQPRSPGNAAREVLEQIESRIRRLLQRERIGAVLVEPIQVRGGINIPVPGFLPMLRRLCDKHGILLILDEIYTGFGRTGKWFACEHWGVIPDLVCLGKALTGGFPLSACVGRDDIMDRAWPPSTGEAIHSSTYLGHPVGCAMALAQLSELQRRRLPQRSARLGRLLLSALGSAFSAAVPAGRSTTANQAKSPTEVLIHGLGLLAGIELRNADGTPASELTMRAVKALLRRGFILLPEGEHANVIGFTPPLTISAQQLRATARAIGEVVAELGPLWSHAPSQS